MMSQKHTEARLEDAIEYCLIEQHGYRKGVPGHFDVERAVEPGALIAFIKSTQLKLRQSLETIFEFKKRTLVHFAVDQDLV